MIALLDDLEARQMVSRADGSWQLLASVAEIRACLPDSVRQLIDIQLDRCTVLEQHVLEAAASPAPGSQLAW